MSHLSSVWKLVTYREARRRVVPALGVASSFESSPSRHLFVSQPAATSRRWLGAWRAAEAQSVCSAPSPAIHPQQPGKPISSVPWNKSPPEGRGAATRAIAVFQEQVLFVKTDFTWFFLLSRPPWAAGFLFFKECCPLLPGASFQVAQMQQVFLENKVLIKLWEAP